MSRPHASPSEPCPRCVVHNRLLRSRNPYCHTCMHQIERESAYDRPPVVASISVIRAPGWKHEQRELYLIEWLRAVAMGHDMQAIEDDTEPGTTLSACAACDGWLVGDPFEADDLNRPTPFYGRAYHTECPGAPPVPPAMRRNIMDEAAPSTSLGREPADREPPTIDINNWLDPEDDQEGYNRRYRKGKR